MSEYLEQLGDETSIGHVFVDLYGKADAQIEAFDALRTATGDPSSATRMVPGTELMFSWMAGREMRGREILEGQYNTTGIETRINYDTIFHLFSRTTYMPRPGAERTPHSVSASRGQELGNDYRLGWDGPSTVRASLGKLGLWQTAGWKTDEPIGESFFDVRVKLRHLGAEDRQRLDLVANGILDNITAAEMIGEGASPTEVLEAMGKPVRVRAY